MKSINTFIIVTLASLTLIACGPKNKGEPHAERIEKRSGDDGALGSADLTTATEQAVEGIASMEKIRSVTPPTVIVMDTVVNRTSDASADFQIYLARIRALLNQSGAAKHLTFVETRAQAEQIKQREGYPAESTARTLPRYALTAAFYDIPRVQTHYYLLTFQLVDLTTDIIVWEDSYEVKL